MFGMCQEVVLNMSGTFLENVWNVSGMYLVVVWKVGWCTGGFLGFNSSVQVCKHASEASKAS